MNPGEQAVIEQIIVALQSLLKPAQPAPAPAVAPPPTPAPKPIVVPAPSLPGPATLVYVVGCNVAAKDDAEFCAHPIAPYYAGVDPVRKFGYSGFTVFIAGGQMEMFVFDPADIADVLMSVGHAQVTAFIAAVQRATSTTRGCRISQLGVYASDAAGTEVLDNAGVKRGGQNIGLSADFIIQRGYAVAVPGLVPDTKLMLMAG